MAKKNRIKVNKNHWLYGVVNVNLFRHYVLERVTSLKKSEKKELKTSLRESSMVIFGQTIMELRRKADLTQEDLAYMCGLDRSFMSKLERGVTSVSLLTLLRLSEGLNVKSSKILQMMEKKLATRDSWSVATTPETGCSWSELESLSCSLMAIAVAAFCKWRP